MFSWIRKSGCCQWSAIPSVTLSNGLKYKIYADLLLISGSVAEFYYQSILLINVPADIAIYQHRSNSAISSSSLSQNPIRPLDVK